MKKKKDEHEALHHQLAALFGDAASADPSEVEGVSEGVNVSADLVQLAYDLAVRAAQQYRLAGKVVPPHVEAAVSQIKKISTLEGASWDWISEIVDSVMKPLRGPTATLAFNYHRLTDKSEDDERLLEQLGEEVKQDWTEGEDNERG